MQVWVTSAPTLLFHTRGGWGSALTKFGCPSTRRNNVRSKHCASKALSSHLKKNIHHYWFDSYKFSHGCLANTLFKSLLGRVLGTGLCDESHHFTNACQCHSCQTILWACDVFSTLESAYLHSVTELQLWSQKSLSLFHIYFVSLIT